jgi:hypothetical protein
VTAASASPATRLPASPGISLMTNRRRLLQIYECCWGEGNRNEERKERRLGPGRCNLHPAE